MKKVSLFLLLSLTSQAFAKTVIWDLGGVLFSSSRMKLASSIGISKFLGYMFLDGANPFTQLEPLLFDVLSHIPCLPVAKAQRACSKRGTPFPPIMCHWQQGTMSHKEIIPKAKNTIKKLANKGYFISKREEHLIEKTIEGMFNPRLLAQSMRPVVGVHRVFKECAHAVNPDGSQKNRNIALSNWDPDSFNHLKTKYPYTFSHFDHLVISGHCGHTKPSKNIYEHLLKEHNLKASECLFIDDQPENLAQAKKLGFTTYHMKGNYRELRRVLVAFGALSR